MKDDLSDDGLVDALRRFGIDRRSVGALPLLPLVQVAWADGAVQAEERELILELAKARFELADEGQRALSNWLAFPPTRLYFERGQSLLVALAKRSGSSPIEPATVGEVLDLCRDVAAAAGGLMGLFTIDANERRALEDLASALHLDAGVQLGLEAERDRGPEERRSPSSIDFHTHDLPRSRDGVHTWVANLDDDEEPERVPVTEDGVAIGRARGNHIQILADAAVSRNHCRVFAQQQRFYVADLGSTRGTYVNSERILERRLFGGEELAVGHARFQFVHTPL